MSERGVTPGSQGEPGVARAAVIGGIAGFLIIDLVVGVVTWLLAGVGAGLGLGLWTGAFGGFGFGAVSYASYYANGHPG